MLVFVAVKLGKSPVPEAAKPILGVSLTQLKTAPASGEVNTSIPVVSPLQNVAPLIASTDELGITLSVNVVSAVVPHKLSTT